MIRIGVTSLVAKLSSFGDGDTSCGWSSSEPILQQEQATDHGSFRFLASERLQRDQLPNLSVWCGYSAVASHERFLF